MKNYDYDYKKILIEIIYKEEDDIMDTQDKLLTYFNKVLTEYSIKNLKKRKLQLLIQDLKIEYGIEKSNKKYRFKKPVDLERALKDYNVLSEHENNFIPLFMNIMKHYSTIPFMEKISKALKKEFLLDENDLEKSENFKFVRDEFVIEESKKQGFTDLISELFFAIKNKKKINFHYEYIFRNKVNKYENIIPLKILFNNSLYYLIALTKKDFRSFRIDSVTDLKVKDEEDYNLDSHTVERLNELLENSPGVTIVDNGVEKYLYYKFKGWAVGQLMKLKIHPSQKIIIPVNKEKKLKEMTVEFKMHVIVVNDQISSVNNDNFELHNKLSVYRENVKFLCMSERSMKKEELEKLI